MLTKGLIWWRVGTTDISINPTGGPMAKCMSTALALLVLPLTMVGCGKDCQATCTKLYGTAPNCGDPQGDPDSENYFKGLIGSEDRDEKMADCMRACDDALQVPGEIGDYDPYTKRKSDEEVPELENDRQVGLWMECVAEHSCQKLSENYCEPIW